MTSKTHEKYDEFNDDDHNIESYQSQKNTNIQKGPLEVQIKLSDPDNKLASNEKRDYEYDSFDTFLFYSFHIIKKWYLFSLLAVNMNVKSPQEFFQKSKNFIWAKEDNWFKKAVTTLVLIPVVIILAVYLVLISLILLVVCLVVLVVFVMFIDIPFMIVLAIQLTLLLLLVYYTETSAVATLSELFLESGIWYTELIWMILFIGLMLKEYDDMGNSVIFITTHYRNKKIGSRFLTWFYILFSCFPQIVQCLVTSYSAWVSVSLIFENSTYLAPFTHFAGLFVVLQVDSFIMEFIKVSKLYVPASQMFSELENWKREERENEKNRQQGDFTQSQTQVKIYSWDQVHFTTRTILKFFGLKEESEVNHFFYNPKFEDEADEKYTFTRLVYFKYGIMAFGMFIILYNFVRYVILVCCS